jgi:hypothetical protein
MRGRRVPSSPIRASSPAPATRSELFGAISSLVPRDCRWRPPSAAGSRFPLRRSRRRGTADHVEARLLLIGQRVVEIGQRRSHSVDRVGKGIKASAHRIEPARQYLRNLSRAGGVEVRCGLGRGRFERFEGSFLLLGRLDRLLDALHRQLCEGLRLLLAQTAEITCRRFVTGNSGAPVLALRAKGSESIFLLVIQRIVERREWRAQNLHGLAHRLDSFQDGVEPRNRRERDFSRARSPQDVIGLCGRRLEIVQHRDLRISRPGRSLDLVDR